MERYGRRALLHNRDGQDVNFNWRMLKRALSYAYPYRWKILLLLLIILVTTGLGLLQPLIFRDLIDNTLPNRDMTRLNILAIGLLLIPLVGGVIRVFQRKLNSSVGEGVIFDLRVSLYTHLQRMSLRFFTNTKTGELMSRLNSDVSDARRAISDTIIDIVTNFVQMISVLGVMIALDWRLTLLGLAIMPLFIPIARRSGAELSTAARDSMNINAQMNVLMNETLNISGALLVKLFGRRQDEINRFTERAESVKNIGIKRAVISSKFYVITGLVGAVGTACVYWLGGYLVLKGVFTIGTIVAFSTYLTRFYSTLQSLSDAPVSFATSLVSFERVFEVIDLPLDIVEKEDAIDLQTVRGEIEFQNVMFDYDSSDDNLLSKVKRHGQIYNIDAALSGFESADADNGKQKSEEAELSDLTLEDTEAKEEAPRSQAREHALENLSFHIKPGQLVALVGPSGAGKTTITYLVPRLYDPTSGRILLDGHDLRDLKLDSLATQIGMVTQETHLFHDTIRTNLLYARLDATQAEIEAACKAANIHDFIIGLPDGYNTIVGERGYRLSGGEKQRIAIARVILKDPRILVLDEATSHLDSQSEALIQEALKTVMQGRTSIVIAHRLSTILAADLILVVDRGQIVEQGRHEDLLQQGGLYANLYETQFSLHH